MSKKIFSLNIFIFAIILIFYSKLFSSLNTRRLSIMGSSFSKNSNDLQEKTFFVQVKDLYVKIKEVLKEEENNKKRKKKSKSNEPNSYQIFNPTNSISTTQSPSSIISSYNLLNDINKNNSLNSMAQYNIHNLLDIKNIDFNKKNSTNFNRLSTTFDDFINTIENRRELQLPRIKKKFYDNSSYLSSSSAYFPYYPSSSSPLSIYSSPANYINSFANIIPTQQMNSNIYYLSSTNILDSIYFSNNINYRDDYIINRLSLFIIPKELTSNETPSLFTFPSKDSIYTYIATLFNTILNPSYFKSIFSPFSASPPPSVPPSSSPSPSPQSLDFSSSLPSPYSPPIIALNPIPPLSKSSNSKPSNDTTSNPVYSSYKKIQSLISSSKPLPPLLTPPKYSPQYLAYIKHYNKKKGYESFLQLANVYNQDGVHNKYYDLNNINIFDNIIYCNDLEYELMNDYEIKIFNFLKLFFLTFYKQEREKKKILNQFDQMLEQNSQILSSKFYDFLKINQQKLYSLSKENFPLLLFMSYESALSNFNYYLYHYAITETPVYSESSTQIPVSHSTNTPKQKSIIDVVADAFLDSDSENSRSTQEEEDKVSDSVTDLVSNTIDESNPSITSTTSTIFFNLIKDTLLDEEWGIQPITEIVKSNMPYSKETTKENIKYTITTNLQADESKEFIRDTLLHYLKIVSEDEVIVEKDKEENSIQDSTGATSTPLEKQISTSDIKDEKKDESDLISDSSQ